MGNVIRATVLGIGLVGGLSVKPNVELNYIEDDSIFSKISAHLIYGWEWGNYASAYETIYVKGSRPPPFDPSFYRNDRDPGGCWGCDNSEYNSPEDDDDLSPEQAEACKVRVDRIVDSCKSTYSEFNTGIGTLCTTLSFGGTVVGIAAATLCSSSTLQLTRESNEWCTLQGEHKKAKDCAE
jgi:hypothetical protein